MKGLFMEFQAMAEKFQLTIVKGMGWLQVVKEGAWMGGGLGPRRGIKDEEEYSISFDKSRVAHRGVETVELEPFLPVFKKYGLVY